jgi:hypothetical protein
MTYIYACRMCGRQVESRQHGASILCGDSHVPMTMLRDYRAEGVAPQVVQLKREREAGGRSAIRDLFLPTTKDFESPTDPDGEKGLRAWADETKPKDGNTKPLWPDMKKKVHAVGSSVNGR